MRSILIQTFWVDYARVCEVANMQNVADIRLATRQMTDLTLCQ